MKRMKLRPIRIEAKEDDFELQSIWPQLSKVLKWLVVTEVDKAVDALKVVACRRKFDMDRERKKIEKQRQLMMEQVKDREKATVKKVLILKYVVEKLVSSHRHSKTREAKH